MKTTMIILSVVGLMVLGSCTQKPDVNALLQNEETREEIVKTITEDQNYMTEFMENVHGSDNAMQMMQGNKNMMGMMLKGRGMQMMMQDSTMMNNMMGNKEMRKTMMNQMMKDGNMMGNMMQKMSEKGMMSKECMQSCMKMMGDKGMDMMNTGEKKSQ